MRQMANGASAPGTCGFEPFVHGLQVAAQRVRPWPCVRSGRLAILANVGFPESVLEMGEVEAAARKLFHLRRARARRGPGHRRHLHVRTVLCRTVANTLSMGFVVRKWSQCSAGKS
jgi:hypothetical protein